MGGTINLGIIDTLDYLPIIEAIEDEDFLRGVNFIIDTPEGLHDRLLQGEVDVAPLPTVEYAEHFSQVVILPDLSLTAAGNTSNLLLFSKVPASKLNGGTICISHGVDSSHILLKILMDHYYEIDVNYVFGEPDLEQMLARSDAALLYQDKALAAKEQDTGYHVLDLGALWREFTQEPMVSALWLAREDFVKKHPVQLDFI